MASERKVVFLGTGDFAVPALEALVQDGYPVRAVYTQPDRPAGRGRMSRLSPVKQAAERLGLSVRQPETLRGAEAIGVLRVLEPDVLVLAAYGLLLPRGFLAVPPWGGLNIHPSLLPRHRGPSPITWALLEGDEETGVTIFRMDAGMDTGPILAQRSTGVRPGETAGALTERLAQIGAELVREVLPRWLAREMEPVPQREAAASYSRLL
ncbi:MAG: methionyl-tRNA formyltransferase [Chloroflexi bacterium]|nr:methionyl-tRNA formyltransferase [Chloroflexota bacterium]